MLDTLRGTKPLVVGLAVALAVTSSVHSDDINSDSSGKGWLRMSGSRSKSS